MLDESQETR